MSQKIFKFITKYNYVPKSKTGIPLKKSREPMEFPTLVKYGNLHEDLEASIQKEISIISIKLIKSEELAQTIDPTISEYTQQILKYPIKTRPFNATLNRISKELLFSKEIKDKELLISIFCEFSYHNFNLMIKLQKDLLDYPMKNMNDLYNILKFFNICLRNPFFDINLSSKIYVFMGECLEKNIKIDKIDDLMIFFDSFIAFQGFYKRFGLIIKQMMEIIMKNIRNIEPNKTEEIAILLKFLIKLENIRQPGFRKWLNDILKRVIFLKINEILLIFFLKTDQNSLEQIKFPEISTKNPIKTKEIEIQVTNNQIDKENLITALHELLEYGNVYEFFCKIDESLLILPLFKVNVLFEGIAIFLKQPKFSHKKKENILGILTKFKRKLLLNENNLDEQARNNKEFRDLKFWLDDINVVCNL